MLEKLKSQNGYAYLDKFDILHAVTAENIAKEYAKNGKVVATSNCGDTGYMVENGIEVHINAGKFSENSKDGKALTEAQFAELYPKTYAVYKQLR